MVPLLNTLFIKVFIYYNLRKFIRIFIYCLLEKGVIKMNKQTLVETVAKKCKSSKAQAASFVDATLDSIKTIVKSKGQLGLVGFGTFKVKTRKARTGRNPQTGKAIKIPAKKVVRFKPSSEFKA